MFQVKKLLPYLYRIEMPYVATYYIQGTDSGLLIDTGWGLGDLKSVVDEIAMTPYEVVLSHGHCDHGGGVSQFNNVWLSPRDFELEKYSCSMEVREEIFRYAVFRADAYIARETWLPSATQPYQALKDGQKFDLGGLTVLAYPLPGHSPGSMIFWLEQYQIMIFGDACSDPTLLNLDDSTTVEGFYHGLEKVMKLFPHIDHAFVSHSPFELTPSIVQKNLFLAEKVLLQQDDRFPLPNKGGNQSYAARNRKQSNLGVFGNIIYSSDKLSL